MLGSHAQIKSHDVRMSLLLLNKRESECGLVAFVWIDINSPYVLREPNRAHAACVHLESDRRAATAKEGLIMCHIWFTKLSEIEATLGIILAIRLDDQYF